MKTALIFGTAGLTGSYLLKHLSEDSRYNKVIVFLRKTYNFPFNEKVETHIVEFSSPETFSHLMKGDDLFCCLGTTIAKAGSRAAFRAVDYELPVKLAETASKGGIHSFIAVSSLGADAESANFYLRTKGEMEREVSKFPFKKIAFLRPSILLGERNEVRFGELIGKSVMKFLNPVFLGTLRKYRAIHAEAVALAMVKITNGNFTETVFQSDKIQEIANEFIL